MQVTVDGQPKGKKQAKTVGMLRGMPKWRLLSDAVGTLLV